MSLLATHLTAEIFVTTYRVGNEQGFATGKHFDLTDYEDKEAFLAAAHDYARDELNDEDPELCFPDYEVDFDSMGMISESGVKEALWEMFELDADDVKLLEAYLENTDMVDGSPRETLNEAREAHAGKFDSLAAYATQMYESNESYQALPSVLRDAIDMTEAGRRLTEEMMISSNNHFFHNV